MGAADWRVGAAHVVKLKSRATAQGHAIPFSTDALRKAANPLPRLLYENNNTCCIAVKLQATGVGWALRKLLCNMEVKYTVTAQGHAVQMASSCRLGSHVDTHLVNRGSRTIVGKRSGKLVKYSPF